MHRSEIFVHQPMTRNMGKAMQRRRRVAGLRGDESRSRRVGRAAVEAHRRPSVKRGRGAPRCDRSSTMSAWLLRTMIRPGRVGGEQDTKQQLVRFAAQVHHHAAGHERARRVRQRGERGSLGRRLLGLRPLRVTAGVLVSCVPAVSTCRRSGDTRRGHSSRRSCARARSG